MGEQQTRFSSIVDSNDIVHKKKPDHSLADIFISEDVGNIKDFVIWSVIVHWGVATAGEL